jgi:hypothetical protein
MRWDLAAQLVDLESRLLVLARLHPGCTIARCILDLAPRESRVGPPHGRRTGGLLSGNGSVEPVDSP